MKHPIRKVVWLLGLLWASVLPALAVEPVGDSAGIAIKGYDPVAYFTDSKAVKGDAKFQSSYNGATYDFASAEHKAAFDKEPAKYAPQFSGFCAYGLSQGHKAPGDPEAFQIVNGRLLLQYNHEVVGLFNKDQAGNLKKADANWTASATEKGK